MIKTLVAHTRELDDQEDAVSEILKQLDLEHRLLKNSVGIIVCHMDFIEEGIVKALCNQLPFDVLGITTISAAENTHGDIFFLALTVLTGNDVSFAAGFSEPLDRGNENRIGELFTRTAAVLPEKPAMTMVFAPMLTDLGGDTVLNHLDKAGGGIPIFGTLAIDFVIDVQDPRFIFNGESYTDRLGIILLAGEFEPVFSVTPVSESKDLRQQVIITKSQTNVIIKMNDMSVGDYLSSIGMLKEGKLLGTSNLIPLIVDCHDNTDPMIRSILFHTLEGTLICGGDVPENSTVKFGTINMAEVLNTSAAAVQAIIDSGGDGLLLFSCAVRNFALGVDNMAEIEAIQRGLGSEKNYMFAYSGGEFCPVKSHDGKLKNRFHNATLISCSFK